MVLFCVPARFSKVVTFEVVWSVTLVKMIPWVNRDPLSDKVIVLPEMLAVLGAVIESNKMPSRRRSCR